VFDKIFGRGSYKKVYKRDLIKRPYLTDKETLPLIPQVFDKILGRGSYKTVYMVRGSGSKYALAVERLRSSENVAKNKISKVSGLVHLICNATIRLTFENVWQGDAFQGT
jgi:hypothetical protein